MIKMLAAALAALLFPIAVARADTFTVEPYDFDGVLWSVNVTQAAFGGTQCPCQKIAYPADGMPWNNQKGADEIWRLVQKGSIHTGDTIMGFSLGVQVISLFMSQHALPGGINVLLAGDTFTRNQALLAGGVGIAWDTPTSVTMVANEYDGWSDFPDKSAAPGYGLAVDNAMLGSQQVHNYVNAQLHNPANKVSSRGNITAVLIPNRAIPIGDESKRGIIDDAYSRPAPPSAVLHPDAAAAEQVAPSAPMIPPQTAEPVAR